MKQVRGPESGVRSQISRVGGPRSESTSPDPGPQTLNSRPRTPDSGLRTVLILIVAGGLLSLYPLQQSIDRQLGSGQGQREELLFLPSEARFSRLSGGYSGLLATIYWTRAVQYYGRHRLAHAQEFALLGPLLDITTNLDPHLIIATGLAPFSWRGSHRRGRGIRSEPFTCWSAGSLPIPNIGVCGRTWGSSIIGT